MKIGSSEIIEDTAKYLDIFLNGLSECGVIGSYTIQFLELAQFSVKDNLVIQNQILQLYTNLQVLLKKLQTSLENESKGNEVESNTGAFLVLKHSPCNNRPNLIECGEIEKQMLKYRGNNIKHSCNETTPTFTSVPEVSELEKSKDTSLSSDDPTDIIAKVTRKEEVNLNIIGDKNEAEFNMPDIVPPISTEDSVLARVQRSCTIHMREPNGTAHLLKGQFTKNNRFKVDKKFVELEEIKPEKKKLSSSNFSDKEYIKMKKHLEPISNLGPTAEEQTHLYQECDSVHFSNSYSSLQDISNPNFKGDIKIQEYDDLDTAEYIRENKDANYSDHYTEMDESKIIKFKVEHNKVSLSLTSSKEGSLDDVFESKRIAHFSNKSVSSDTSRAIFADIVKLGPNDLNGHPWCQFCQKEFPSAGSLKRHLTNSHTKVLWCHTCLKAVSSKAQMKRHIAQRHLEIPNICIICGKSFKSQHSLQRHLEVHNGSRGTACEICGQTFARSEYHKEHMRVHTGEKPFKCDVCKKSFGKSSNLKTHMLVHKPANEGHVCTLCLKVFRRQDKLKDHTMRHLKIKRFACKLCSKAYSEKRDLTKHIIKIHNSNKNSECT